jgi:hypothetical protein
MDKRRGETEGREETLVAVRTLPTAHQRKGAQDLQVGSSNGQVSAQDVLRRQVDQRLLHLNRGQLVALARNRGGVEGGDGLSRGEEGGDVGGHKGESLSVRRGRQAGRRDGRIEKGRVESGSAVNGDEVGHEPGDVRGGHGRSGDGVGGGVASGPGGEDVESGSEDVDALAVVGEIGALVGEGRGADGDGFLGGGGGVATGVLVVVSGGNLD